MTKGHHEGVWKVHFTSVPPSQTKGDGVSDITTTLHVLFSHICSPSTHASTNLPLPVLKLALSTFTIFGSHGRTHDFILGFQAREVQRLRIAPIVPQLMHYQPWERVWTDACLVHFDCGLFIVPDKIVIRIMTPLALFSLFPSSFVQPSLPWLVGGRSL